MLGGEEPGVVGNPESAAEQLGAHFGVVRHRRERPGTGVAMFAAAGAAVQRPEVRVVVGLAAVPAQHHEPPEVPGQADGAQPAFDEPGLLGQGEPERAGAASVGGCGVDRHAGGDRVTEPARHRVGDRRWTPGANVLPASPAPNTKPSTSTSISDDSGCCFKSWNRWSASVSHREPDA